MIEKTKDGQVIVRRDRPLETAEWLAADTFRKYRFKSGKWWVNCALGDEKPDWIEDEEAQLRSDVWVRLSGQVGLGGAGVGNVAFHPRSADVDEIMDALRGYLFDSENEVVAPSPGQSDG